MERGFTLLEGGLGQAAKAIWTFAFDKLKGSADDGNRLLYLDFGGDDAEIVSKIFFFLLFISFLDFLFYLPFANNKLKFLDFVYLLMEVQYCLLFNQNRYRLCDQ